MLETDDLFLTAFGMVRGADLVGVDVRQVNGRKVAFFLLEGEGLELAEREYYRESLVSLPLLKSHVRRLKDVAFDAVRRDERRGDVAGVGGGYRAAQAGQPHRGGRR